MKSLTQFIKEAYEDDENLIAPKTYKGLLGDPQGFTVMATVDEINKLGWDSYRDIEDWLDGVLKKHIGELGFGDVDTSEFRDVANWYWMAVDDAPEDFDTTDDGSDSPAYWKKMNAPCVSFYFDGHLELENECELPLFMQRLAELLTADGMFEDKVETTPGYTVSWYTDNDVTPERIEEILGHPLKDAPVKEFEY